MNGANGRYTFYTTIPAIIGLEQEIPIYRAITDSSSPGESTTSVIQLRGIELQIYLYSFVSSQYPEAAVWKSEHGFASAKGYAVLDGRVYRDQDLVELATAECMNPFELAARISAMREKLREYIVSSNGDYVAYCDSGEDIHGFSFHENYLAQSVRGLLSSGPANFLVSRAVLTGTGGPVFHENTFCLSPRLSYTQSDNHAGGFGQPKNERLHLVTSDQIYSPTTIALQAGMTAFAVRLTELGLLPEAPVHFFLSIEEFNAHVPGKEDALFVAAVEYQRQVFLAARQYADTCVDNGLFPLFGEHAATEHLLALWDDRLTLLEQYCLDWDVEKLANDCEWAAKAVYISSMREQCGKPGWDDSGHVTDEEITACKELTNFAPSTNEAIAFQETFGDWEKSLTEEFSVPRAAFRAYVLSTTRTSRDTARVRMNWESISVKAPDHRDASFFTLPTPFHGANELPSAVARARNTPVRNIAKLVVASQIDTLGQASPQRVLADSAGIEARLGR